MTINLSVITDGLLKAIDEKTVSLLDTSKAFDSLDRNCPPKAANSFLVFSQSSRYGDSILEILSLKYGISRVPFYLLFMSKIILMESIIAKLQGM